MYSMLDKFSAGNNFFTIKFIHSFNKTIVFELTNLDLDNFTLTQDLRNLNLLHMQAEIFSLLSFR